MYFERTNKGTIFDIDNQRLEEEEDIYIYILREWRNIFSRNNKKKKRKKENYGIISFVVFQNVFLSFILFIKYCSSLLYLFLYIIKLRRRYFSKYKKKSWGKLKACEAEF